MSAEVVTLRVKKCTRLPQSCGNKSAFVHAALPLLSNMEFALAYAHTYVRTHAHKQQRRETTAQSTESHCALFSPTTPRVIITRQAAVPVCQLQQRVAWRRSRQPSPSVHVTMVSTCASSRGLSYWLSLPPCMHAWPHVH